MLFRSITGAAIARQKECDRINAITTELKKMGADITETTDGLIIKQSQLHGTTVNTYNDHRMVMSLFVAGLEATGETIIKNTDSITKSYKSFFADMDDLGCTMELIA